MLGKSILEGYRFAELGLLGRDGRSLVREQVDGPQLVVLAPEAPGRGLGVAGIEREHVEDGAFLHAAWLHC